jgi:hypothetical protein
MEASGILNCTNLVSNPFHKKKAKKFVESVPRVVRENMSKEDAEKLKALFEGLGAVVVLE